MPNYFYTHILTVRRPYLISIICFFLGFQSFSQGVRGRISTEKSEALPFASVIVKNSQYGTMANQEGNYELKLGAGTHDLVFQFLGYQSITKTVKVAEGFSTLNVSMKEQVLNLGEVRVQSNNEDPANTIVRKAIATAPIHLKEYDSYSAKVYLKGTIRLTNIPTLMKSTLKKDGIEENISYMNETVLDLRFKQPNKTTKKVIAARSNLGDAPDAQTFVGVSFYSPTFGGFVSPLSPKAFSYYRFEYLGTTTDRGYEISRIKVMPRSKGDEVFEGVMSIVENNWSIHSLDFKGTKEGIGFRLKQVYAPIQEVFMPITDNLRIAGGMLGFKGEYVYNISYHNYQIKVNPTYHRQIELIDEKVSRQKADKLQIIREEGRINLPKTLAENKEINRKQLKKVLREQQKEETKTNPETNQIVREDSVVLEKQYDKKSLAIWDTLRTTPLTELEIKSSIQLDSIKIAKSAKTAKDSVKKNTNRLSPAHFVFGHGYSFGKADSTLFGGKYIGFKPLRFYFSGFQVQFNAVESWKAGFYTKFQYNFSAFRQAYLRSDWAWSEGLKNLNGLRTWELGMKQIDSQRNQIWKVNVAGGNDAVQFQAHAIPPLVNTIWALGGRNYIRLYQKKFINLNVEKQIKTLKINTLFEVSERSRLENYTNRVPLITDLFFEPNVPKNIEYQNNTWQKHTIFTYNLGLNWQPWLKYIVRNGMKISIDNSSPQFGFKMMGGYTDSDYFSRIEGSYSHQIKDFLKGTLNYHFVAGKSLKTPTYFMDYRHFDRNPAFLLSGGVSSSYRLFNYYQYSTSKAYGSAFVDYGFRKFAFSQIPQIRLLGIKERAIANYLRTPSMNYWELGYGVDNIFRVLRIEVLSSFANGQYQNWGFRLGMTGKVGFSRERE